MREEYEVKKGVLGKSFGVKRALQRDVASQRLIEQNLGALSKRQAKDVLISFF